MTSAVPVVLMVVDDSELAAGADRISAAVAARPVRAEAPSRRAWLAAAAIVVDESAARRCALAGLPRREGVVLLGNGRPSPATWAAAIEVGAQQVCELPAQEAELMCHLAVATEAAPPAGGAGPVLAVVSGGGGSGASVFAAALGSCAQNALVVDLDPCGGGVDLLLGCESLPGLRWPDLRSQGGRLSWIALREALPGRAGLSVLSGTRSFHDIDARSVAPVLDAARRGGATVIVDISRQLTPAATCALQYADLAVLVISCDVRGIASAGAMLKAVRKINHAVGLVVRGPSPGGLSAREVGDALGAPVLAAMRPEPMLMQSLEKGGLRLNRRSPLARAAAAVLELLDRSRRQVA